MAAPPGLSGAELRAYYYDLLQAGQQREEAAAADADAADAAAADDADADAGADADTFDVTSFFPPDTPPSSVSPSGSDASGSDATGSDASSERESPHLSFSFERANAGLEALGARLGLVPRSSTTSAGGALGSLPSPSEANEPWWTEGREGAEELWRKTLEAQDEPSDDDGGQDEVSGDEAGDAGGSTRATGATPSAVPTSTSTTLSLGQDFTLHAVLQIVEHAGSTTCRLLQNAASSAPWPAYDGAAYIRAGLAAPTRVEVVQRTHLPRGLFTDLDDSIAYDITLTPDYPTQSLVIRFAHDARPPIRLGVVLLQALGWIAEHEDVAYRSTGLLVLATGVMASLFPAVAISRDKIEGAKDQMALELPWLNPRGQSGAASSPRPCAVVVSAGDPSVFSLPAEEHRSIQKQATLPFGIVTPTSFTIMYE